MRQGYLHICVILDGSASMANRRDNVLLSLNAFLNEPRVTEWSRVKVDLYLFAETLKLTLHAVSLNSLSEEYLDAIYQCEGPSAINDAFCTAVDYLGVDLATLPENERPERVLIAVITDGLDNCSSSSNLFDLRARLAAQTYLFNWRFEFFYAQPDQLQEHCLDDESAVDVIEERAQEDASAPQTIDAKLAEDYSDRVESLIDDGPGQSVATDDREPPRYTQDPGVSNVDQHIDGQFIDNEPSLSAEVPLDNELSHSVDGESQPEFSERVDDLGNIGATPETSVSTASPRNVDDRALPSADLQEKTVDKASDEDEALEPESVDEEIANESVGDSNAVEFELTAEMPEADLKPDEPNEIESKIDEGETPKAELESALTKDVEAESDASMPSETPDKRDAQRQCGFVERSLFLLTLSSSRSRRSSGANVDVLAGFSSPGDETEDVSDKGEPEFQRLYGFLKSLVARDREVVKLLFGLCDGRELTYAEVDNLFQTPENTAQICENKALDTLLHMFCERLEGIDPFDLKVVAALHGFNDEERSYAPHEVGERLGLTASRVQKIETETLERLRLIFFESLESLDPFEREVVRLCNGLDGGRNYTSEEVCNALNSGGATLVTIEEVERLKARTIAELEAIPETSAPFELESSADESEHALEKVADEVGADQIMEEVEDGESIAPVESESEVSADDEIEAEFVASEDSEEDLSSDDALEVESDVPEEPEDDSLSDDELEVDSDVPEESEDDSLLDDELEVDSVAPEESEDDALSDDELGDDSVVFDEPEDDALSDDELEDDSVVFDEPEDYSLSEDELEVDSVVLEEPEDDSLSEDELDVDSVVPEESEDDFLSEDELEDDFVVPDESEDDSSSDDELEDDSVVPEEPEDDSSSDDALEDDSVVPEESEDDSLSEDELEDDSVVLEEPEEDSSSDDELDVDSDVLEGAEDDSSSDDELEDDSVVPEESEDDSSSDDELDDDFVVLEESEDDSLSDDELEDDSVVPEELEDDSSSDDERDVDSDVLEESEDDSSSDDELEDDSVVPEELEDDALSDNELEVESDVLEESEEDSLSDDELDVDSVVPEESEDDFLSEDELEDDSIVLEESEDDSSSEDELEDDSIVPDELEDDSLSEDELEDDSVVPEELEEDASSVDAMEVESVAPEELGEESSPGDAMVAEPVASDKSEEEISSDDALDSDSVASGESATEPAPDEKRSRYTFPMPNLGVGRPRTKEETPAAAQAKEQPSSSEPTPETLDESEPVGESDSSMESAPTKREPPTRPVYSFSGMKSGLRAPATRRAPEREAPVSETSESSAPDAHKIREAHETSEAPETRDTPSDEESSHPVKINPSRASFSIAQRAPLVFDAHRSDKPETADAPDAEATKTDSNAANDRVDSNSSPSSPAEPSDSHEISGTEDVSVKAPEVDAIGAVKDRPYSRPGAEKQNENISEDAAKEELTLSKKELFRATGADSSEADIQIERTDQEVVIETIAPPLPAPESSEDELADAEEETETPLEPEPIQVHKPTPEELDFIESFNRTLTETRQTDEDVRNRKYLPDYEKLKKSGEDKQDSDETDEQSDSRKGGKQTGFFTWLFGKKKR